MTSSDQEKNWIVKSSTRLIGPYSTYELYDLIKKRQVSLIDEVRRPEGRWTYIRENKVFADVVKKLNEMDLPTELTSTGFTSSDTISKTENILEIEAREVEESESSVQAILKTLAPITPVPPAKTEPPLKEVKIVRESIPTPMASKSETKSFGVYDENRLQREVERQSRPWLIGVATIILVLVGGFLTYSYLNKNRQTQSVQSLLEATLRYKSLQLYEKALESFKKARALKEPELEIQAKMAPLLIEFENETNQGRKILESYLLSGRNLEKSEMVEAQMALGLSQVAEGNIKKAEEHYLKVLGFDPFNRNALTNISLLRLRNQEYRDSYINLKKVNFKEDEDLSVPLMVKGLTLIEMSRSLSFAEEVRDLTIDIANQLRRSNHLRNELMLINLRLLMILKDEGAVNSTLDRTLESPIRFSSYWVKNLQIDRKLLEWENLDKICLEIFNLLSTSPKTRALRAFCLIENQKAADAKKYIEEGLAQAPQDPHLLNAQITWFYSMGLFSEAQSLMKKSDSILFPSTRFLQGQLCLDQQNFDCATTQFRAAAGSEITAGLGFLGLAQVAAKNQKTSEALQNISQGLKKDTLLLPLLELRENLESVR